MSLAGPAANLLTAFIALLLMVIFVKLGFPMSYGLHLVFYLIVLYNINFAIFNMIPLPPLWGQTPDHDCAAIYELHNRMLSEMGSDLVF